MSSFRSSQVYDVDGEIDTSQQSRYNRQLSEYDEEIQRAQEEEEEDRRQAYQQQQSNIRRANSSTPGLKRAASSSGSSRRVGAAPTVDRSQSLTSSSSSSSSQRHGRGFSQLDPDMAKNFKVVVRIRPPLPRELDGRGTNGPVYRDIVRTEDQNCGITICENGIQSKDGFNTTTTTNPDGTLTHSTNTNSGVYATHKFTFDYVYDQDAQQADVYNNTAKDAVLSTLQGYNATILAYGQTGTGMDTPAYYEVCCASLVVQSRNQRFPSIHPMPFISLSLLLLLPPPPGKTFSMEGFESYELRGIIPRSVEEIFNCKRHTARTACTKSRYLHDSNGIFTQHSPFMLCHPCCADIQNTAHTNVRFLVRASYLQIYSSGTHIHARASSVPNSPAAAVH